ncbi:MAG: L,D-transpeptidase family protein [Phycisphaerales bacterium]|jgi:lipoprotein-anchoring transpeptidase ErfK/SrfK|nr:L,D-transpeptidase family protein [Phycisphaerales bacterium]
MSLPSQSGMSLARRGTMYRRRRGRKKFSWFLVFAAGAAITWFLWPDQTSVQFEEVASVEVQRDTPAPVTPPAVEIPTRVTPVQSSEVAQEQATAMHDDQHEPVIEERTVVEATEVEVPEILPLASTTPTSSLLEDGLTLLDNNQLAAAQRSLSAALRSGGLTTSEEAQARGVLADLADDVTFSPRIDTNDPYSIDYTVRSGDSLSGIVQKMGLQVDWRFIQRINSIRKPSAIRVGQNLKLVTGPFHVVIDKDTYRADVYLGDGNDQIFVRSYKVGLGEYNSTPTGLFKVRRNSKLINPPWINPRTREPFSADNPLNPIGERWIGLEGIDERTKDYSGLGIHGTIEPQTIGTDASMGCIRMHEDDVSQVYEMLVESVSTIDIR